MPVSLINGLLFGLKFIVLLNPQENLLWACKSTVVPQNLLFFLNWKTFDKFSVLKNGNLGRNILGLILESCFISKFHLARRDWSHSTSLCCVLELGTSHHWKSLPNIALGNNWVAVGIFQESHSTHFPVLNQQKGLFLLRSLGKCLQWWCPD